MRHKRSRKAIGPIGRGARAHYRNDGSMLPWWKSSPWREAPVIEKDPASELEEARLALAHEPGSVTPIFGATLGSVAEAGERLGLR